MMTQNIPMPVGWKPNPMKPADIERYRAILAFQLRSMLVERSDIAAILKLPSEKHAKRYIETGRRLLIDCVINTVLP